MRQMDFETNIELRVPSTGKVYMIDRMTSDWAERHPLNVDQLIEDVYQEFAGTEFEESREALRKVWTATLSVRNPQGDASIYPNNNGARRAAAMKIWHTAGDYWRRGLRIGDTLPERCPSCKITRLEDGGWIALFPKDMHLLEKKESTLTKIDNDDVDEPNPNLNLTMMAEPRQMELFDTEEEHHQPEAVEVEAVMKQAAETDENEAEASVLAGAKNGSETAAPARSQTATGLADERRRRRTEQRERQRMTYMERMEREAREAEEAAREEERRKIFAAVVALAITAVMIYFFGLLGPAVFGLLCGGLLKG